MLFSNVWTMKCSVFWKKGYSNLSAICLQQDTENFSD